MVVTGGASSLEKVGNVDAIAPTGDSVLAPIGFPLEQSIMIPYLFRFLHISFSLVRFDSSCGCAFAPPRRFADELLALIISLLHLRRIHS